MSMEMIDIAKRLLASSIDGKTFSEEFLRLGGPSAIQGCWPKMMHRLGDA